MMMVKMFRLIGVSSSDGKLLTIRQIVITVIQLLALAVQINFLIKLWPNPTEIFKSIILYLLATQSVIRGISRYTRDDEKALKDMNKLIDNFFNENDKNEKFCEILSSRVKLFRKIIMAYLIICCIFFHLPVTTGWILSLITGKFILAMPIKFPYLDSGTIFGFLFCQTFTTLVSTILFFIITTGDTINLYFTLQTTTMVEIFCLKLQLLGDDLMKVRNMEVKIQKLIQKDQNVPQKGRMPHKYKIDQVCSQKVGNTSKPTIQSRLRKLNVMQNVVNEQFICIIKEYNTYNDYISRILSFRELITFTTLYLNFIGIGLSLVTVKFSSISFGIAAGMIFTLQVFIHCVEGTLVTVQNEKLLTKVQEFPWYELSSRQKKIFLQFLCICQCTNSFSLSIFGDVNMELFTDIMHAAYSFLMYVIQFVNV